SIRLTVANARRSCRVPSFTITQPPTPTATPLPYTTLFRSGGSTTVTVSATGGTTPYSGTGSFSRGPGTWSFTVTDARGCSSVTWATITQPDVHTAPSVEDPIIKCNGETTTVTVSATGGTTS